MEEINNKIKENIYLSSNNKGITIRFDKFLPMKENDDINNFIIKKRSYINILDLILEAIIRGFSNCPRMPLYYLKISKKLNELRQQVNANIAEPNKTKYYSEDEIIEDIMNLTDNKEVFDYINNYVEANYKHKLDEESESSKKVNEELQFTDAHAKTVYKASEAMKITIPLALVYCELVNIEDTTDFLYKLFYKIIGLFKEDNINVMNKLHRFIYSRLTATQYSDNIIWSKLNSQSRDVVIYTDDFYKELIISIFPKVDFEQSLINFLHVVIKQKLKFEFIKKYKIDLRPVNTNQVDSDGISEFEKMDINLTKINEGKSIINKLTIGKELCKLPYHLGDYTFVSDDELDYYKKYIHINSIQTKLTFMFFTKIIGNYNSLYNSTKSEYIKFVVIFHKWLKEHKMYYLADLVLAKPEKINERIRIKNTKSAIFDKIVNSVDYKNILENKYSLAKDKIMDADIILKLIGDIVISRYIKLNEYVEGYDPENIFGEQLSDKMEDIFSELITLIKYF